MTEEAREAVENIVIPAAILLLIGGFLFLLLVVPSWWAQSHDQRPHVKVTTTQTKEVRP